jgi:hypothetical protein
VLDEKLRGDLRHVIVGVVHSLPPPVAKREGQRVSDFVRGGRAKVGCIKRSQMIAACDCGVHLPQLAVVFGKGRWAVTQFADG